MWGFLPIFCFDLRGNFSSISITMIEKSSLPMEVHAWQLRKFRPACGNCDTQIHCSSVKDMGPNQTCSFKKKDGEATKQASVQPLFSYGNDELMIFRIFSSSVQMDIERAKFKKISQRSIWEGSF